MKRRSARPFVVELKSPSRTNRTPHRHGLARDRTDGGLWHGLLPGAPAAVPAARVPVAFAAPATCPFPASRPEPSATICRRILPNLMLPVASDTENDDPTPVIRRRGPNRRPRAATVPPVPSLVSAPASPPAQAVVADSIAVPEVGSAATGSAGSHADARPAPKPGLRRSGTLKPGERWKRRLSRFAR